MSRIFQGCYRFGAGDGNRTRIACLEGRYSTIELRPQNGQERIRTSVGLSTISFTG